MLIGTALIANSFSSTCLSTQPFKKDLDHNSRVAIMFGWMEIGFIIFQL